MDVPAFEHNLLPIVDLSLELFDEGGIGRAAEDSLGLEAVGLGEEVDALKHDGRDLRGVVVVTDPLQTGAELLGREERGGLGVGGERGF